MPGQDPAAAPGELGELLEQWIAQRAADTAAAAAVDQAAAELAFEDDWEACGHDCDDDCYDEWDQHVCRHQHCWNCGGCNCPGYCDDYQTYNLRPGETGGES